MVAKFTRLTHKIATQLYLMVESSTICSSRSRPPVRKLLEHFRIYFMTAFCASSPYLFICHRFTADDLSVAGSLGGSRGNLGPKDNSASALHQVDVSTQVSVSILHSMMSVVIFRDGRTNATCSPIAILIDSSGT
jgi:hypothetical protein